MVRVVILLYIVLVAFSQQGHTYLNYENDKLVESDFDSNTKNSLPALLVPGDNDDDGIPDAVDLDDDNDGILDTEENSGEPVGNAAGTGVNLETFYWINWGADFADGIHVGDVNMITLSDGSVITITVAAADSGAANFSPSDMQTWSGAQLSNLYNTPGSSEALYSNTFGANGSVTFAISAIDANGVAFKADIIFSDAETTDSIETNSITTNGSSWKLVESTGTYIASGEGTQTYQITNTQTGVPIVRSNGVTEVALVSTTGGGLQAMAFGIIRPTDTDADGTPDYLDIDSDKDGCPDAIEAAGSFDADDLDGDNSLGDTVDTNPASASYGVPTGAGAGQATTAAVTTSGPDADFDGIADACDPIFNDNDGDTIPDATDLDDDNDGILDSVECPMGLQLTGISPNLTLTDADSNTSDNTFSIDPGSYKTPTFNVDATGYLINQEWNGNGTNNGEFISTTQTYQNALSGVRITVPSAGPNISDVYVWKITWTGGTAGASGIAVDNNAQNNSTGNIYDPSSTGANSVYASTIVQNGYEFVMDNDGELYEASGASGEGTLDVSGFDFYIQLPPGITSLTLTGTSNQIAAGAGLSNEVFQFDFSQATITSISCDTDADGDPDYLDTDSDNDGCPDAIEAAGSFDADDLDGDNSLGDTVDTDPASASYGVPTAAGAGQATTTGVTKATQASLDTSPSNQFVANGSNATFTVAASATSTTTYNSGMPNYTIPPATNDAAGLRYQWQENSGSGFANITNGVIYSGATTASLLLTGVSTAMDGYDYKVIVTHIDKACFTEEDEASLTVENEIIANDNDFTATPVDGTNGGSTATVYTDDTLEGAAFTNAGVIPTITDNDGIAGLVINVDGTLTIPANSDAGTYSITYQICETANTTNCDTATVDIVIENEIIANDDDFSTTPVDGTNGGTTATVFTDDTLDGAAFSDADVIPTITNNDGITGLAINADGTVSIPANTDAGTYSITYQICETANTSNCDTAVVDIVVENGIIANDDDFSATPVDGTNGGNTATVFTDDTLDGAAFTNAAIIPTITNNDGIAGLVINADGTLSIPANTNAGTYSITYQICEAANTTNCDTAIVEIVVMPDSDGDGVFDSVDLDDDNDGILDTTESGGVDPTTDADGDGIPLYLDDDDTDDTIGDDDNAVESSFDNDGDGISNHLDLDADNDGIYDVIESGGVDTNNDGRADDNDDNVDNTGTNGIPTSAGSGIVNPTDTGNNNSADYLNTDSDGDGCVDSLEAGFADDNDDGIIGDAPVSVDVNGLVTSATGYTAPTETNTGTADYVDKTVNGCAGISVTKKATLIDVNNNGIDDAGDKINYTFVVKNTGTVDLTDVKVTDALATVTPATTINLAAGATDNSTYTASYTLQQTDINNGSFTNTAIAEGTHPGGTKITDTSDDPDNTTDNDTNSDGEPDDPTKVDFTQEPSISLLKTGTLEDANADGFPNAGEKIRYSFTVQNTGNVTLTGVTINDPLATVLGGPIDLEPGDTDTTTFYALYTLTQPNVDNGSITNAAVVTGKDPNNVSITDNSDDPTNATDVDDNNDGDPDDDTVTALPKNPKIEIFKTGAFIDTNTNGVGELGESIGYIFDVRNTGNVTISNITITDPLGPVSGGSITLAPGQTDNTSFTFSYPLTQPDINAGQVLNRATVQGKDPDNVDVDDMSDDPTTSVAEDSTKVTLTNNPKIALFKTSVFNDENGDTFANVGETITYTFDVRNVGNVTLNDILITDPKVTVTGGPISLAPAQFDDTTFEADYILTQLDIEAGTIENQAEVKSKDATGMVIEDVSDFSDDPTNPNNVDLDMDGDPDDPTVTDLPSDPKISLEKVGVFNDENNDGLAQVGETMSYSFRIENTGNIAVNNVVVTDPIVAVNGNPIATMAPGAIDTTTFTATYAIQQTDIDAGMVSNLATVTGQDASGTNVTDDSDDPNEVANTDNNNDGEPDDPTILETPQSSSISLTKTASPSSFVVIGDVINYSIEVTNTGNTTLSNIVVTDNNATITAGSPIVTLAPGGSATVDASYTIVQNDMFAETFTNVATVISSDPQGLSVSDDSDDPADATNADANGDGEPDDPTIIRLDSDQDGIPNTEDFDDDNDGITDVEEQNGMNFLDTDNDGIVDRLDTDADGDGILDVIEAGHGIADTDGDGRLDGPFGTDGISDSVQDNPNNEAVNYSPNDTDNDGIHDFQDVDDDGDGVLTSTESADGTDYLNNCDLVIANISLAQEAIWDTLDCDGDGVTNQQEVLDGTDPTDACDYDASSITLAITGTSNDCDGDGVTNQQELADGTDPDDPCDYESLSVTETPSANWNNLDCDSDGLSNQEEIDLGTDPENPDTDGDNILDGQEVLDNTSALDPCESIGGTPPAGTACGIAIENELMTPDGDGINDSFRIRNIEMFPDNTVEIFNRWGVKVFTARRYDNDTNTFRGISNGRVIIKVNETLPAGIYYYVINFNDGGVTESMTGYLYINQ